MAVLIFRRGSIICVIWGRGSIISVVGALMKIRGSTRGRNGSRDDL